MDRVRRVTEALNDDGKGSFKLERGCLDDIFTLKQFGEKA